MDTIDYESLPESNPIYHHLAAGAFAGILEHSIMYPVDNIKTRIQTSSKVIVPKGNILNLWKGISAMIIGAGPAHAIYFAIYEIFKQKVETNTGNNFLQASLAGATATICSEAVMNPFDTVKQRMQVNSSLSPCLRNPEYKSIFSTMRSIHHNEGVRSFYYSYPTTLLMTIPFHSTNFLIYESMTSFLNPQNTYNPFVHCLSGGVAGGVAGAITTPLDCIKTCLQTHNFTKKIYINEPPHLNHTSLNHPPLTRNLHSVSQTSVNNFLSAFKYIYQNHGVSGFFKGIKPRIVFNVPATAISWTGYEMAKAYLSS